MTVPLKTYEQAKHFLTQQIHSLHLRDPFKENVICLLVCVPFSLDSISKYGIYVIDDIGTFSTLLSI